MVSEKELAALMHNIWLQTGEPYLAYDEKYKGRSEFHGVDMSAALEAAARVRAEDNGEVPVAVLEFARKQPGNENEMPRVISCNWLSDGQYEVYTHPAPQSSGKVEAALEALEWALAEIEGRTRYDSDEQFDNAMGAAKLALTAGKPEQSGWRPIETAPHNRSVLLGWRDWRDGNWCMEVGAASWGTRAGAISNMSGHGSATHWMPLPTPPTAGGGDAD